MRGYTIVNWLLTRVPAHRALCPLVKIYFTHLSMSEQIIYQNVKVKKILSNLQFVKLLLPRVPAHRATMFLASLLHLEVLENLQLFVTLLYNIEILGRV